jgi:hypothetical protein
MWEIAGFVISIVALVAAVVFYVKSTRLLQHIGKVIVDFLQMAMNNPDIKPKPGKGGIPEHWDVTLHPGSIPSQEQVSDNVTVIGVPKKQD